jgi:hypothetical protein
MLSVFLPTGLSVLDFDSRYRALIRRVTTTAFGFGWNWRYLGLGLAVVVHLEYLGTDLGANATPHAKVFVYGSFHAIDPFYRYCILGGNRSPAVGSSHRQASPFRRTKPLFRRRRRTWEPKGFATPPFSPFS